jgi:hypothetical protein
LIPQRDGCLRGSSNRFQVIINDLGSIYANSFGMFSAINSRSQAWRLAHCAYLLHMLNSPYSLDFL